MGNTFWNIAGDGFWNGKGWIGLFLFSRGEIRDFGEWVYGNGYYGWGLA